MIIDNIEIVLPVEKDWPWIAQKHFDSIWTSLSSQRRLDVTTQDVLEQSNKQIEKYRKSKELQQDLFVAKLKKEQLIGFVWLDTLTSQFTGEKQAFILDIFVEESFRKQGVGKTLLKFAYEWCRKKDIKRIGLNVSVHNKEACAFYESSGFVAESIRMTKQLSK